MEEQKRAKKSTKMKLKASEENCSWSQSAPAEKCSWSDDVIRSKFIRSISSEAKDHQKLKFIRRWET